MLIRNKIFNIIKLFCDKTPPIAHINYSSKTMNKIWKINSFFLKKMLNENSDFKIYLINRKRIKYLSSFFPDNLLISIFPEHLVKINDLIYSIDIFKKSKKLISKFGFKSYYSFSMIFDNEETINKIDNYFHIFNFISQNYYKNRTNIGLNFCINLFDNINININKLKLRNIIGFSIYKSSDYKKYNFYIGLNINKNKILSYEDTLKLSNIFIHEQTHIIDAGIFCSIKKPFWVIKLFSQSNKKKSSFYHIYKEILNHSYDKKNNANYFFNHKEIEQQKIILYDSFFKYNENNKFDKIIFINKIEKIFYSSNNKKKIKYMYFFNKDFFYYLYKKDNHFQLFYKNFNSYFLDNYFYNDFKYLLYLLRPEEKFANTRFLPEQNPYVNFLFEEIINDIFNDKNKNFHF